MSSKGKISKMAMAVDSHTDPTAKRREPQSTVALAPGGRLPKEMIYTDFGKTLDPVEIHLFCLGYLDDKRFASYGLSFFQKYIN